MHQIDVLPLHQRQNVRVPFTPLFPLLLSHTCFRSVSPFLLTSSPTLASSPRSVPSPRSPDGASSYSYAALKRDQVFPRWREKKRARERTDDVRKRVNLNRPRGQGHVQRSQKDGGRGHPSSAARCQPEQMVPLFPSEVKAGGRGVGHCSQGLFPSLFFSTFWGVNE